MMIASVIYEQIKGSVLFLQMTCFMMSICSVRASCHSPSFSFFHPPYVSCLMTHAGLVMSPARICSRERFNDSLFALGGVEFLLYLVAKVIPIEDEQANAIALLFNSMRFSPQVSACVQNEMM